MSIEEKVRPLRMRIRFHLNRMQAEQADAEILEFAREIERTAELRAMRVALKWIENNAYAYDAATLAKRVTDAQLEELLEEAESVQKG